MAGEFDFEAGLAQFDKEAEMAKLSITDPAEEDTKVAAPKAYDKSTSFFDTISSDATDRSRRGRMNRAEERQ